MRIALVTQHCAPHFEGGTEAVVRSQALALARRGHELRVIAGTDRPWAGTDVLRSELDGIPVAHLPRKGDESYDLALARPRLCELLRREVQGAELVHVHHWSTLSSRTVREVARDAPVALTLHDFFATCPRFFRVSPVHGLDCPPRGSFGACVRCVEFEAPHLERAFFERELPERARAFEQEVRAAFAVLAPSRFLARALEELLGLESGIVRVLPHGLPRTLARTASPLPWGGRHGRPRRALRVLHLGPRSDLKGTLDLVHALAALPTGTAELRLAGDEAEAGFDRLLQAAAGSLPLRSFGRYDERSLPEIAAGCDLAAFPSRAHESYGLAVEEALALGLPAWVSNRGALPERIGVGHRSHLCGRVLPAGDAAAWTAAFRSVFEQPEALAEERARVPSEFRTSADAARELEHLYAERLGSRA